jgi:hypothetical protein
VTVTSVLTESPIWSSLRARATVTEATGAGLTVMSAFALLPSLCAIILTEPSASVRTNPSSDTVAIAELLDLQVICLSESPFPCLSRAAALS